MKRRTKQKTPKAQGLLFDLFSSGHPVQACYKAFCDRDARRLLKPANAEVTFTDWHAGNLAQWLIRNPSHLHKLNPDGQFHRTVFELILADRAMTPEIRRWLAQYPNLAAYLI